MTAVEAENPFGWTAFGSNVWLLLTGSNFGLLVSHNGGRTFSKRTSGYDRGVVCDLTATSPITLWGFCVTGNGGYAFRSTDGGRKSSPRRVRGASPMPFRYTPSRIAKRFSIRSLGTCG